MPILSHDYQEEHHDKNDEDAEETQDEDGGVDYSE